MACPLLKRLRQLGFSLFGPVFCVTRRKPLIIQLQGLPAIRLAQAPELSFCLAVITEHRLTDLLRFFRGDFEA